MKLNKKHTFRAVGLSSFFALLALLGMAVFCPTVSGEASAATRGNIKIDFVLREALARLSIDFFLENGASSYEAIGKELGIDFHLLAALMMSELHDVDAGSQPIDGTSNFYYGAADFSVESSASNGYSVYVYSARDHANMIGDQDWNSSVIPTIQGSGKYADILDKNWWGYDLDEVAKLSTNATGLTYYEVPVTQSQAAYTSKTGEKADLKLAFGTKVDAATVAPDTYTGIVTVHAVPGAEEVTMHAETVAMIERVMRQVIEDKAAEQGISVDELLENARAEKEAREAAEVQM